MVISQCTIMQKVTITIEDDILRLIDDQADGNRNNYINKLLKAHYQQILETEMITALQEDANNREYQAEIAIWDSVVGDGIDA